MKLLFDNNLSHKLVARLNDIFPNSTHVMTVELDESEDVEIWTFAKENDFTIVTKDIDFNEISLVLGYPPKIIWIRVGDCKVIDIEKIIRKNHVMVNDFYRNQSLGIIEIG